MRRLVVVLVALFLVNLPFAHQTLTDREVARSGRLVDASVVAARTVNGRHLVDFRLPASADRERSRYSARLDDAAYARARETGLLPVRVVPGKPSANRPEGEVSSPLFAVVALGADAVLVAVCLLLWRRWRRWALHEVVAVDGDEVTLASRGQTVTVRGPEGWSARLSPGDRVVGALSLLAAEDVLPDPLLPGASRGLEQLGGPTYVARGRVVDARAGLVRLELDAGLRLRVDTGGHRIRADIRDSTEVRGELRFGGAPRS